MQSANVTATFREAKRTLCALSAVWQPYNLHKRAQQPASAAAAFANCDELLCRFDTLQHAICLFIPKWLA